MRTAKLIAALVLVIGLTACSNTIIDPLPRNQVVANMDPILDMEKRFNNLSYYTKMLGSVGSIPKDKSDALQDHYDVYYVYYITSNTQLAGGNIGASLAHVKLANRELDSVEKILKSIMSDKTDKAQEKEAGKDRSASKSLAE